MQDRPNLVLVVKQGLCHLRSVTNTTQKFSDFKFRKKNIKFFGFWKNTCHTVSYVENAYQRDFIHFSLHMELHETMKLYGKIFSNMEIV